MVFSVKSSRSWIQEKQDQRLFNCTLAAVRTADPEGQLTILGGQRWAKSSKISKVWGSRGQAFLLIESEISCFYVIVSLNLCVDRIDFVGKNLVNSQQYESIIFSPFIKYVTLEAWAKNSRNQGGT